MARQRAARRIIADQSDVCRSLEGAIREEHMRVTEVLKRAVAEIERAQDPVNELLKKFNALSREATEAAMRAARRGKKRT